MCDPMLMAAASFAVGAVQSVAQYQAQEQQAEATQKAALASMRDSYQQAQVLYEQNANEAAQKEREGQLKTRAAKATAVTSAGESGLQGSGVATLANDYAGQQAVFVSDVELNKKASDSQVLAQARGARSQAVSRIASAPSPSILGAALGVAGSAVNAYGQYSTWSARQTPGLKLN